MGSPSSSTSSSSPSPEPSKFLDIPVQAAPPGDSGSPSRRPITNWASIFPETRSKTLLDSRDHANNSAEKPVDLPDLLPNLADIDPRGKTRAEIKAEEYERSCGQAWKQYKACLQRAIGENESLSSLLQQARDEHPLRSQEGLNGSAWDPKADFSAAS